MDSQDDQRIEAVWTHRYHDVHLSIMNIQYPNFQYGGFEARNEISKAGIEKRIKEK